MLADADNWGILHMNEKLKAYFPIADMIVATFGSNCEAVVHDLAQPRTSVVYVAGQITGREVGQSFDHLIKNVLLNKKFHNDQVNNYIFKTPAGRTIKSSSVLIRDEGEVIGMLCVNYDITIWQEFYNSTAGFCDLDTSSPVTNDTNSDVDVTSIIDGLIDGILEGFDPDKMTRKNAVELVRFMDEKGIFLVKGAIDKVAARMGVSKVTIYSYLDEAKGKK